MSNEATAELRAAISIQTDLRIPSIPSRLPPGATLPQRRYWPAGGARTHSLADSKAPAAQPFPTAAAAGAARAARAEGRWSSGSNERPKGAVWFFQITVHDTLIIIAKRTLCN